MTVLIKLPTCALKAAGNTFSHPPDRLTLRITSKVKAKVSPLHPFVHPFIDMKCKHIRIGRNSFPIEYFRRTIS